jgi:Uma2 family endonuclease
MSSPYTEVLESQKILRAAPGPRHELICGRLHKAIQSSVVDLASTELLLPRSEVNLCSGTTVCPDLALVARPTGKLWLAIEVVNSDDHHPDTVVKKQLYEEVKLPRLWMVDPRYDNVEIYHGNQYGIALKGILAGREALAEKLIPEFQMTIAELFAT